MAPTIVKRDGKPFLALGSPGGSTIITTVLQILIERLDLGKTLPQAIAAPRAQPAQRDDDREAEPAFMPRPYGAALTRAARPRVRHAEREIGAVDRDRVPAGGRLLAAAEPVAPRRRHAAQVVSRP